MDRNKTELTHQVTAAALSYFKERGFKPLETEVPISGYGIADLAGVCEPTRGETQLLKILPARPYKSWSQLQKMSVTAAQAYHDRREGWERLWRSLPSPLTALVEVKTARGDFLKDRRKWAKPPVAHLRYLFVPRGLIRLSEFPDGWGVVEVEKGTRLRSAPVISLSIGIEKTLEVVLQIAKRHYNRHAFQTQREFEKAQRVKFNEEDNRVRWANTFRCILRIAKGGNQYSKSVEEVLASYRIRSLPGETMKELRAMWGQLQESNE